MDSSMLAEGDPDAAVQAMCEKIERIGMAGIAAGIYDGFFVDSTPAAVRAAVNARRASVDLDFAQRLWLDLVRWDAARCRAALQAVNVPALVIQSTYLNGEMKRVSLLPGQSAPWSDTVAKTVKDVTVTIIPGIGHFPMLEAPRETNEAIASLCRKCRADGPKPIAAPSPLLAATQPRSDSDVIFDVEVEQGMHFVLANIGTAHAVRVAWTRRCTIPPDGSMTTRCTQSQFLARGGACLLVDSLIGYIERRQPVARREVAVGSDDGQVLQRALSMT